MQVWKTTPKDAVLVLISVGQLAATVALAVTWDDTGLLGRVAGGVLLVAMTAYNVIVVSHLFTHVPWFVSRRLNALVSVLNSVNIGQSVQAYQFTHVRNHHRFNNDRPEAEGTTRDFSSTYRRGTDGQHQPLLPYAFGGAFGSLVGRAQDAATVVRLFAVGRGEKRLLSLASRKEDRARRELRQIQADRAAHSLALVAFALASWQWTLFCYVPAFFCALALVNVQNYYRHYGANPEHRTTDSVSHYGRLYNALTFNDGFHQEHHLNPGAHWSSMPDVHERQRDRLDDQPRIVSPVPAMLGFLDRRRPLLHERAEPSRTGS